MRADVGQLRQQCALKSADTPVVLVTKDPGLKHLISALRVVAFYPDTTDAQGNWSSTFKIEIEVEK